MENMKISELKAAEYNPRKISNAEMEKLKQSIKEFGFVQPIVINTYQGRENVIIGGHQRLEAARELGHEEVPCIKVSLSPNKEKLLNVALNRIQGEWEENKLKDLLLNLERENENVFLTGFSDREIDRLLGHMRKQDDNENQIPEKFTERVKLGDIWQCGKHKIMCGDCTSEEDMKKLMGEEMVDLILTDPPYNLGYKYHSFEDSKSPEEYKEWCTKWFNICKNLSDKVLITVGPQNTAMWCTIEKPKWILAWFKENANSGCALRGLNKWEPIVLYGKFEPVLFYGNIDKIIPWDVINDANFTRTDDTYEVRTAFLEDSKDGIANIHSCPKPVKLWARLIKDFTRTRNIIMDVFLGSGTSLIACEKTKRVCYGMEIDPYYVDVAITRWENYTGEKAIKKEPNQQQEAKEGV